MNPKVEMADDTLLRIVEEAADDAPDWHTVGTRLRKRTSSSPDDPIKVFVWAFEYMLLPLTEPGGREQWGPYAPCFEGAHGVFPPRLSGVEDKCLAAWAEVGEASGNPIVRSRLRDLLWERRWTKRPDLHARLAIDAYIALGDGSWTSLDRAYCLIRALELARAVGDSERLERVIPLCARASRTSMAASEAEPGVALRLIRGLMWLPVEVQPSDLDDLLEQAERTYAGRPSVTQTVLDLKASRSKDPAVIRQLRLRQVDRWRREASRETGLRRLHRLEKALELARNYGFTEIAEELRRDLQRIGPEEMDLKVVSVQADLPAAEFDNLISAFLDTPDWRVSLSRFGGYGPPSGDYQANVAQVNNQMREFPLQFLVTKIVLGADNAPIRIVTSQEDHRDVALSQHEAMRIAFWGTVAADVLDRVCQQHGEPEAVELARFFVTPLIPEDIAERIGRALLLYWRGQPDESAHLMVPRIETTIRAIARESGLAIIHEPYGEKPGGVRPLGELLRDLRGFLDESWQRYLWNLLCDPPGTNLRNRIAHGLLPRVERAEAALLIHAACYLRLLRRE